MPPAHDNHFQQYEKKGLSTHDIGGSKPKAYGLHGYDQFKIAGVSSGNNKLKNQSDDIFSTKQYAGSQSGLIK